MSKRELDRLLEVYTPLGKGRVVYVLPDKGLVVEFPHGGGQIFRPEQLMLRGSRRASSEGLSCEQGIN